MLRGENLFKSYGSRLVLRDISFEIDRGSCTALIGPNGCGKSTLIKTIAGVERLDKGKVWLNNDLVHKMKRRDLAKVLTVLPQESLPSYPYTVKEILEMGRFPYRNFWQEITKREKELIAEVVEFMNLEDLLRKRLFELSGGERQRVNIAQKIIQEPEFLLMDEPTTFLDIGYQVRFMSLLINWQKEKERTLLMVIHDLNLAINYCDNFLILDKGELVFQGNKDGAIKIFPEIFQVEASIVNHPINKVPQILLNY